MFSTAFAGFEVRASRVESRSSYSTAFVLPLSVVTPVGVVDCSSVGGRDDAARTSVVAPSRGAAAIVAASASPPAGQARSVTGADAELGRDDRAGGRSWRPLGRGEQGGATRVGDAHQVRVAVGQLDQPAPG